MTPKEKVAELKRQQELELKRSEGLAGHPTWAPPENWDEMIAHSNAKWDEYLYGPETELNQIPATDADSAFGIGFYSSLRELHAKETVVADDLMIGVRRRQVTIFASVTNVGKTTVMLNHALAAAGGQLWNPLLPNSPDRPLKVIFIDGESTDDELKKDTRRMLDRIGCGEVALDNFIPVVDGQVNGGPLDLTKPKHFEHIKRFIQFHKPDIVIIDTITSLFSIYNENDNAEIVRKVIRPLKALAIAGDCAVWASHHIGKAGESEETEGAYRGRGASAFGANVRGVITLRKEKALGDGYVRLCLEKSKGSKMEPVNLKLDFAGRTFDLCATTPQSQMPYQQLIGIFNGRPLKTKEIKESLSNLPERTIERILKEALDNGDLLLSGRGVYSRQLAQSCNESLPEELTATTATPIGVGGSGGKGLFVENNEDNPHEREEPENRVGGNDSCTILQRDEELENDFDPILDAIDE